MPANKQTLAPENEAYNYFQVMPATESALVTTRNTLTLKTRMTDDNNDSILTFDGYFYFPTFKINFYLVDQHFAKFHSMLHTIPKFLSPFPPLERERTYIPDALLLPQHIKATTYMQDHHTLDKAQYHMEINGFHLPADCQLFAFLLARPSSHFFITHYYPDGIIFSSQKHTLHTISQMVAFIALPPAEQFLYFQIQAGRHALQSKLIEIANQQSFICGAREHIIRHAQNHTPHSTPHNTFMTNAATFQQSQAFCPWNRYDLHLWMELRPSWDLSILEVITRARATIVHLSDAVRLHRARYLYTLSEFARGDRTRQPDSSPHRPPAKALQLRGSGPAFSGVTSFFIDDGSHILCQTYIRSHMAFTYTKLQLKQRILPSQTPPLPRRLLPPPPPIPTMPSPSPIASD